MGPFALYMILSHVHKAMRSGGKRWGFVFSYTIHSGLLKFSYKAVVERLSPHTCHCRGNHVAPRGLPNPLLTCRLLHWNIYYKIYYEYTINIYYNRNPSNKIYYYHLCQCHGKPGGSNRVPAPHLQIILSLKGFCTQCTLSVCWRCFPVQVKLTIDKVAYKHRAEKSGLCSVVADVFCGSIYSSISGHYLAPAPYPINFQHVPSKIWEGTWLATAGGKNCCRNGGKEAEFGGMWPPTKCVRAICSLRARWARRLGLWERGGGLLGHTWCVRLLLWVLWWGHISWETGPVARYASRFHLPSSAKSILRPPAMGLRHTHIRRGGKLTPHGG